ncbi:MAG TPA: PilZ domain-containing protein [Sphingomicrobium sp.]|nr:PilZ domain-containing protein [Sphingomicrobium sp.]
MANYVASPQDDGPCADRRIHPRVPVALPAFLRANGERHSAQLLDLSSGGAKLNCPASLSLGAAVILDCGTLGRAAVVRWQNGALLGLRFDSELAVREISELIERSKALAAWLKTRD